MRTTSYSSESPRRARYNIYLFNTTLLCKIASHMFSMGFVVLTAMAPSLSFVTIPSLFFFFCFFFSSSFFMYYILFWNWVAVFVAAAQFKYKVNSREIPIGTFIISARQRAAKVNKHLPKWRWKKQLPVHFYILYIALSLSRTCLTCQVIYFYMERFDVYRRLGYCWGFIIRFTFRVYENKFKGSTRLLRLLKYFLQLENFIFKWLNDGNFLPNKNAFFF